TTYSYTLSLHDALPILRTGHIDYFAGIAQANRRKRFDFARFQRQQHLVNVGESTAFALGAGLGFGHVVNSQNHVLCGHSNWLSRSEEHTSELQSRGHLV